MTSISVSLGPVNLRSLAQVCEVRRARVTWIGTPQELNEGRKHPFELRDNMSCVVELTSIDDRSHVEYVALISGSWSNMK